MMGVAYRILEVLPKNKLKVEFELSDPNIQTIRIIEPNPFYDYSFLSINDNAFQLVKKYVLEDSNIKNIDELIEK